MLKRYKYGENYYLFEEGKQPEGAVEDIRKAEPVKVEKPKEEVKVVAKTKNKSKGVKTK